MEIELEIAKLEPKAGDLLVIQSKKMLALEVVARIKQYVQPNLPEGVKVLVIDPSVTLSMLTAAEIASRTS